MTDIKVLPRNWTTVADGNIGFTQLKPSGILFPFPTFYIYRLLTSYNQAITQSEIVFEGSIVGAATYQFKPEPENQGTLPPLFRAYLEGFGAGEYARWWSADLYEKLEEKNFTFRISLTPQVWGSVYGKRGNDNPDSLEGFHSVLMKPSRLGLAFGGGSFTHGAQRIEGSSNFVLRKCYLI